MGDLFTEIFLTIFQTKQQLNCRNCAAFQQLCNITVKNLRPSELSGLRNFNSNFSIPILLFDIILESLEKME